MPNLFGVDFRGVFATAMGGLLLPMTVTIRTPGTSYDASDPGAGPRYTETTFTCKGAVSITEEAVSDGEVSLRTFTGEMVILLGTINTAGIRPKIGDSLVFTVPGASTTETAEVTKADYDPAGAAVVLKLKG